MQIKKDSIGTLTHTLYDGSNRSVMCVIITADENTVTYLPTSGNGSAVSCKTTKIVDFKATRSLSESARNVLKKYAELHREVVALRNEIQTIQKKVYDKQSLFSQFEAEYKNSIGELSLQQFVEELEAHLPDSLRREMERFGYRFTTPLGICYKPNGCYLSRYVDIEKYFRHGSFVYEEYDGTVHMDSDCEQNKEYQAYLKKYRHQLSLNSKCATFKEALCLGDKDWLSYACTYEIKLTKPLTREYASELAASLKGV